MTRSSSGRLSAAAETFSSSRLNSGNTATIDAEARLCHKLEALRAQQEIEKTSLHLKHELDKVGLARSLPMDEMKHLNIGMDDAFPLIPNGIARPMSNEYQTAMGIGRLATSVAAPWIRTPLISPPENPFNGTQGIWSNRAPMPVTTMNAIMPNMPNIMPAMVGGNWNNTTQPAFGNSQYVDRRTTPTSATTVGSGCSSDYVFVGGDNFRYNLNGVSRTPSAASSCPQSGGALLPPYQGPPYADMIGQPGPSRMAPLGPVGSRLSPTAAAFRRHGEGAAAPSPWNSQVSRLSSSIFALLTDFRQAINHSYVPLTEPINYRRLLDKNLSCDWSFLVHKIITNNDQQASIFLQQKLKLGTNIQKWEIVSSIIRQAYGLMVNRFGNFLVQRCFEHGTDEQVVGIAQAIMGNTVALSMDAFGCHVIQKAFDSVPEYFKARMVEELLKKIPETVVHRYSCHVWQKLFELRWSDSPPEIMNEVNLKLAGIWHEVALGETGSLVVQNIFENCLEVDKVCGFPSFWYIKANKCQRPCIDEVLGSIDVVIHGQFGNWCIQHICEHGAPHDRERAINHILTYAVPYSMDQYASKAIEKCLKVGGTDFLQRYLERICEPHADRPRLAIIDSEYFGSFPLGTTNKYLSRC
jgi:hypothetical protein